MSDQLDPGRLARDIEVVGGYLRSSTRAISPGGARAVLDAWRGVMAELEQLAKLAGDRELERLLSPATSCPHPACGRAGAYRVSYLNCPVCGVVRLPGDGERLS